MAVPDDAGSDGSILRDLVFNQYQAILLGGSALMSLVAVTPVPLLVWLGAELMLLPVLDSGPLRRLVHRRRRARARRQAGAAREALVASLTPANAERYLAMDDLCRHIEANYQGLTGISQAYLSEQRGKLDHVLQGCLGRLTALERYARLLAARTPRDVEDEIAALETELGQPGLPPRAVAAIQKNLDLKQRLLASLAEAGGTVKALETELDSMASLLEVLHQNSISLRDPQAISAELDAIVRQSEDSERVVREMEALLRANGAAWGPANASEAAPAPERARADAARRRTRNR